VGGSSSARVAETKSNHPRISPLFQALLRISAWNGPDARRLARIPDYGRALLYEVRGASGGKRMILS